MSAENHQQLWVPEGFAHGFLTLSAVAEVQYKTRGFWNKACERAIRWDDPALAIAWPLQGLTVQVLKRWVGAIAGPSAAGRRSVRMKVLLTGRWSVGPGPGGLSP